MATTRLQLRVAPGARRARVVGRHGDGWKLHVTAPPEDGRANDAVVRLLADTLSLSRSEVTLVAGRSSRDKVVELAGVEPSYAEQRLTAATQEERA
jgi:uncharacterized protein (TIGR00251 family)